jgi:soluble lytic murein transglycosylase-like protein
MSTAKQFSVRNARGPVTGAFLALTLCAAVAFGQSGSPVPAPRRAETVSGGNAKSPSPAAPTSLELQRRSIKAMQDSIALQRATAQKQSNFGASTLPLPPIQASAIEPVSPVAPAESVAPLAECDPLPEPALASVIAAASTANQVSPDVLRAMMRKESAFRPCAVSPKGAMGLMQIMPDTADYLKLSDPFDPAQNVDAGARYLRELMGKFGGDLKLSLAAYNAGPAKVDGEVPANPETQSYVEQILGEIGKKALFQ